MSISLIVEFVAKLDPHKNGLRPTRMNVSGANPKARNIARCLIAYETVEIDNSETTRPASLLVCEKLRRPLSTLTGVGGFRSLIVRALALAKRETHGLDSVQVAGDGSLEISGDTPEADGSLLVTQLLGLLMVFIGNALTMRLLVEIWPDLLGVDFDSEEKE
jgi:hypothetical protein